MSSKVYVGNLPFEMTDGDLQELFTPHGAVTSAKVVMDRETGQPRGFGFVEMEQSADAQKAIETLNGQECKGRTLKVNLAKPREERPGGFGRR